MKTEKEFDVFLCHNSEDKPAVTEVAERLKAKGLKPWLDSWELRPGLDWQDALEAQVKEIKVVAVFVGSAGLGPWQKQEIKGVLSELVERGCLVIPVLLRNAPEKPEIPIFLKSRTWVDFRLQEPNPMSRLFWGITGRKENSKVFKTKRYGELVSESGTDYARLDELLASQSWKAADYETNIKILECTGRTENGYVKEDDLANLPISDIRIIDHLWSENSNDYFGFSAQRAEYIRLGNGIGGTIPSETDWEEFGRRIGWLKSKTYLRTADYWKSYDELDFDLSSRKGHLPIQFAYGKRGVKTSRMFSKGESILNTGPVGFTAMLLAAGSLWPVTVAWVLMSLTSPKVRSSVSRPIPSLCVAIWSLVS